MLKILDLEEEEYSEEEIEMILCLPTPSDNQIIEWLLAG